MITSRVVLVLLLAAPVVGLSQTPAPASTSVSNDTSRTGILPPSSTEKLLPASVLFKGQLAPVQARNAGMLRNSDGSLIVAAMVDSSGYSTGVRERFQFFLYTETPLQLGDKTLTPGFYGAGFLADQTMVVLDVSGHDLFSIPTVADPGLKRPRPLQLLATASATEFRLYLGRSYVTVTPAH